MNEVPIFDNLIWDENYEPIQIDSSDVPFINNPHEWILLKIDEFESLKNNWDGYGSIPVLPEIAGQARNLICMLDGDILEKLSDVFPNPHGTIMFEWENNDEEKLGLEIGKENYSYFVRYNGKKPKIVNGKEIFQNHKQITEDIQQLFS